MLYATHKIKLCNFKIKEFIVRWSYFIAEEHWVFHEKQEKKRRNLK